ncbi:Branched-chain-amino-acid aminotransferase 3 [Spatholobus suberectus]|nr:Branched-chain-amino-acid aminotransferase 3 [Spatholobus suberectus]
MQNLGKENAIRPGPYKKTLQALLNRDLSGFINEGLAAIDLVVENESHRATPGGTGGVKTIGNYAAALKAQSATKAKGYSDVLYLDSVHNRYLEEVSFCNIFVKGNVIPTPAIEGTIIPGITRKSIPDIAEIQGFQVEERLVSVDELLEADEVFCTEQRVSYGDGIIGSVSQKLYTALTRLQMGLMNDEMNWTVELK